MSLDINQLVKLIKRAAVEAVQASSPMGVEYGLVTSISPLGITVDQKKILTEAQLILTNAVRDYALQMGEKVILLRCDGGQQYIVLDRWEART